MLPPFDSPFRWTVLTVPWTVVACGWRSPAEREAVELVVAWAASRWSAACAIELPRAGESALIVVEPGDVPAAHGQMPSSTDEPRSLVVGRERWCFLEDPPRGRIDLGRVLLHELGHLLGVDHLPAGSIMAPRYDRAVRSLSSADRDQVVRRYGPRATPIAPIDLAPIPEITG